MALLGALILVAAVVGFILQPVLQGHWASLRHEDDEMTEAEARRRVTLLALRDAEYDFATGKLDVDDYTALKRQLSAEALAVLQELEASEGSDLVEAEIAAARKELEEEVRCDTCRHHNPTGSRFCGACGAALVPQETAGAP
jgi:hypothetical protein